MLQRAVARSPGLGAVTADAAALPVRSASVDLVCFAQSWHWVPQPEGAVEVARVLRPGGWWAAWWSHPWADDTLWWDAYQEVLERSGGSYSGISETSTGPKRPWLARAPSSPRSDTSSPGTVR